MKARPLTADDERHGTINAYQNLACRCERCKAASREYQMGRYAQRDLDACGCGKPKRKISKECRSCYLEKHTPPHGTESRYNSGCRCIPCKEAARTGRANRRSRTQEQRQ